MTKRKIKRLKKQEPNQEAGKKHCTFYLKLSNVSKLQKMAEEQGRKLSTIIDRLIEAA